MNTINSNNNAKRKLKIPDGYREILEKLTYDIIISQPEDVLLFCINNLNKRLLERERKEKENIQLNQDYSKSLSSNNENFDESETVQMLPKNSQPNRRGGILGESWDPEKITSDQRIVYPKTEEQKQNLIKTITEILLFRCLEEEEYPEIVDAMFEKKVKTGENVITCGEEGDNFYVIENGNYDIYIKDGDGMKKVGEYQSKGSFGELALMYNTPRAATVTAATDGTLWAMSRETFVSIVLAKAFKKRQLFETYLESVDLLANLSSYERMNLADALYTKNVNEGEAVFLEGSPGNEMYFIINGSVSVQAKNKDEVVELCRLGPHQYFGELALVTKNPRAASVYALEKTKLSVLEVESFERILGPCENILKRKIAEYASRRSQLVRSL